MGRGHGGTGGSTWRGRNSDRTMQGYSSELQKAVTLRENSIRFNDSESMTAFDENGNILFEKQGNATSVTFYSADVRDRIITHNHPGIATIDDRGRQIKSNSLSKEDVVSAVGTNAKEMRAVTQNYRFSIKRPEGGWNYGAKTTQKEFTKQKARVLAQAKKYVANYKGDKRDAWSRVQATFYHQINKEVAKNLGYEYTKQKIY